MVMISSYDSGITATWVDGYIPSDRKLIKVYKDIRGRFPDDKFSGGFLFYKLAEQGRELYCGFVRKKLNKLKTKPKIRHCDFFLFNSKDTPIRYRDIPDEFPFYRDIKTGNKRQRYSQLVFVADHDLGCEKECIYEIVKKTGFIIRKEETYQDLFNFQKYCEWLLKRVMEPYIAPCIVAENRIIEEGFQNTFNL